MKQPLHAQRLLATISLTLSLVLTSYGQIAYVKHNAAGSSDGTSWTNAYTNVQAAIDAAATGETICVAQGVYMPTFRFLGDSLRHSTFYINKDVRLFGGFTGEAGSEGTLDGRDPKTFVTTLSGDLGITADTSDNAFHVVYLDHVSAAMRLDGFTIANGNSQGGTPLEATGTGIFNNADGGQSHPTIANCVVRNNWATESGGGMANYAVNGGQASPSVINTTFMFNSGSGAGAMMSLTDNGGSTSPVLIGCKFMGNTGRTASGGALSFIAHDALTAPHFINCIITGNHGSEAIHAFVTGSGTAAPEIINSTIAGNAVGSIRVVDLGTSSSSIVIRNSILWNNPSGGGITSNGATEDAQFSIIPFGFPGEGVIGLNPLFVSAPSSQNTPHILGDVHVTENSPALDAGRNADVPAGVTTDADGSVRFLNASNGQPGVVDLGAYEFQNSTTGIKEILFDTEWRVFPNPASDHLSVVVSASLSAVGEIAILDAHGRKITAQQMTSGQTQYRFDVSDWAVGLYFIHINIDGAVATRKVMIGQ